MSASLLSVQALKDLGLLDSKLANELLAWIERGTRPSAFVACLLANDLNGACLHAVDAQRVDLWYVMNWVRQYAPSMCWGTMTNFETWPVRLLQMREAFDAKP